MMCLQELATIERYQLPIRIFLFNNAGHSIQKQTMEIWLNGRLTAADHASGLCFPDYELLANAFRLKYLAIKTNDDMQCLEPLLQTDCPFLCNVEIDPAERIVPMLKFGKGIEDLTPSLPEDMMAQIKQEALETELIGK